MLRGSFCVGSGAMTKQVACVVTKKTSCTDQSVLSVSDTGGRRFATPMDLLWQINYGEMLSGLTVTTFLILLDASVVVVCSMVMFPLIDLAFKKKAKPAPRPAQVETQLSGQPWLALRSAFLRPDAVPHLPLPLVGLAHHALAHPPLEYMTPLIVRSLVPKGSDLLFAKGRPGRPGDPNKEAPGRRSWAA
jgi:hypothetical protein